MTVKGHHHQWSVIRLYPHSSAFIELDLFIYLFILGNWIITMLYKQYNKEKKKKRTWATTAIA